MEIWKDIEGYEEYQVSNYGNIKSLNYGRTGKEKILKPKKPKNGYLYVCLCNQGKRKGYLIHRLVAEAFIDNPNNYKEINHRDEDKANNAISNLEWCDRKHNCNYGTRNQRMAESCTNNPKKSKQVLCVETNKIYASTNEVERQLGFARSYISKCCNGKYKQAYGYTWQYIS